MMRARLNQRGELSRLTRWAWKTEDWLRRQRPAGWRRTTPHPELAEALGRWTRDRSDIQDHLAAIFAEAVAARPRLILELGTRGGLSTFALLAAAEIHDAIVLSVDIEDCAGVEIPARLRDRWNFVLSDDVDFAGEPFERFCAERGLPAQADVIFIDTSHLYDHTKREIAAWAPRLSGRGTMLFHDTNMGASYRTLDGHVWGGWDNARGVIRAIEEHLGRAWDEKSAFVDVAGGFLIEHRPWCNGLTVLRRLGG